MRAVWALRGAGETRDRDFSGFQAFSFAKEPAASPSATAEQVATRKANRKTARDDIQAALAAKGYRPVASGGDFVVTYRLGTHARELAQAQDNATQGELDIYFMRAGERNRFWGGWAWLTLYGEIDAQAEIRRAVTLILADVQPRSVGS